MPITRSCKWHTHYITVIWNTVAWHSPLRVSCCLAGCRWLGLHPGLPCLPEHGLKMTFGFCECDRHLWLTLHAAVRSHCTNCLFKIMRIGLVCCAGHCVKIHNSYYGMWCMSTCIHAFQSFKSIGLLTTYISYFRKFMTTVSTIRK